MSAPCGFREAACPQSPRAACLQAAALVRVPSRIPAPELPASVASTAAGLEAGDRGRPSGGDGAYSRGRRAWRRSRRARRFAQQRGPLPSREGPGRSWSGGPAGEGLLDSVWSRRVCPFGRSTTPRAAVAGATGGRIRPVLKHGPRSVACVRVFGVGSPGA